MAGVNNQAGVVLNLTDDQKPNQHTGRVRILRNAYPTPPGVADEFWFRLLKTGNKQVDRINPPFSREEKDAYKFRKAYNRLLVHLRNASPTGNKKQQAVFQTRVK